MMRSMSSTRLRTGLFLLAAALLCASCLQLYIHEAQEMREEARHPLSRSSFVRSRVLQEDDVRYLSFGSSFTWGEGLDDPEDAYPYKLSPNARNAANRFVGAALSAACTQSVVGEEVYDVITIEFVEFDESHAVLARRIRQRFPSASIVFVQVWSPSQVMYHEPNESMIDLLQWQQLYSPEAQNFEELLATALDFSSQDQWSFVSHDNSLLYEVAEELNGQIFSLPSPDSDTGFEFSETVLGYLELFNFDNTLSRDSHTLIAEGIHDIVGSADLPSPDARDSVGSWGSGDHCSLWYSNGNFGHLQGGLKVEFAAGNTGSHKHALEFGSMDKLRVENPFSTDRMLYLTYMTGADDEYPRTRVHINNKATVMVDPFHEAEEELSVHYARTSAVGFVPPGESFVDFEALQPAMLNFRLVGASIISDEMENIPMDFALEPEPVAYQRRGLLDLW